MKRELQRKTVNINESVRLSVWEDGSISFFDPDRDSHIILNKAEWEEVKKWATTNKFKIVGVRFHDLPEVNSGDEVKIYEVFGWDNCKTEFDKSLYHTVIQFMETITIGKTIGEPIWG